MSNTPKIAIVGATGLVGQTIIQLLKKKEFFHPSILVKSLTLCGRESVGETVNFFGYRIPIKSIEEVLELKPDIVIMSAGEEVSKEFAPKFLEVNPDAWVIDNSTAWRMDENIPLILPHINWRPSKNNRLIPVPNCVAIMLATALHPLLKLGLKFASATVMQSVSGAGNSGMIALDWEQDHPFSGKCTDSPFPFQVYNNIQQATAVPDGAFTNEEENKVVAEIKKIFGPKYEDFHISPSCFRDGRRIGHWARVRVQLPADINWMHVKRRFQQTELVDCSSKTSDALSVVGKDYIKIYDLRIDQNFKSRTSKIFEFTVVSDNLRIGAASTALLCVEKIIKRFYK